MKTMDTAEILTASEKLSFLLRELSSQKNMVEAEVEELTRINNDIVHQMEREDCKYKERSRLATQLAKIRKERRILKDWLKTNEPYFRYMGNDNGDKSQKMISNLVGIGRRIST